MRFDLKRRSDRMKARDCGAYANRNPAAHEVRDDETPPPRRGAAQEGAEFIYPRSREKSVTSSSTRTKPSSPA